MPSTAKDLFALKEPVEPGSAIVKTALLPAASLIAPPFNVNELEEIYPKSLLV